MGSLLQSFGPRPRTSAHNDGGTHPMLRFMVFFRRNASSIRSLSFAVNLRTDRMGGPLDCCTVSRVRLKSLRMFYRRAVLGCLWPLFAAIHLHPPHHVHKTQ